MKGTKGFLGVLLALLLIAGGLPLGVWAATVIPSVEATVTTPIVGETISTISECTFGTLGVQLTDMNWTKENGAIYPAGTKFKAGETYYCDMEFTAQDGYTFPDSYKDFSGTINGMAGEVSSVAYYKNKAYLVVAFTPTLPGVVMIGDVAIYNREYLAVGSSTPTSTKPTSGGYAYLENYVLTLHNFTYQGIGLVKGQRSVAISSSYAITIVVEGENSISCQSDMLKTNGIWTVDEKDLTINGSTDSSLAVKGNYSGISSDGNLTINNMYMGVWGDSYGGIFAEKKLSVFNSFLGTFSSNFGIYCREACTLLDTYLEMDITNGVGLWCANATLETQDCTLRIASINHAVYLPDGGWAGKNTYLKLDSTGSSGVYSTGDIVLTQCRGSVTAKTIAICAVESALSFSDCQLEISSNNSQALKGDKGIAFLNGQVAQGAVNETAALTPYKADQNATYGYVKLTKPLIAISSVETFIHLPVAGDKVGDWYQYFSGTEKVEITKGVWTKENGEIYPDETVFEKGKTYYCDLEVVPEEGYCFPDSYKKFSGTINGRTAEVSSVYYQDHAYLTLGFVIEEEKDLYLGGIGLKNGEYLAMGSTTPTTTKPADRYAYYKDGVITLKNYSLEGNGYVLTYQGGYHSLLFATKSLTIVLEGNNTLTPNHPILYGSGIEGERGVDLQIVGKGDATLDITSNDSGIYCDGVLTMDGVTLTANAQLYGIYGEEDITFTNCTLKVNGENGDGIYLEEDATLTLQNCKGTVYGEDYGLYAWESAVVITDCNLEISAYYGEAIRTNVIPVFSQNQQVLVGENKETLVPYNGGLTDEYQFVKIILLGGENQPDDPVLALGDVNGDGQINAKDALEVLKQSVGKVTFTQQQKNAADVNRDEKIDAKDALEILKKTVGKPAVF